MKANLTGEARKSALAKIAKDLDADARTSSDSAKVKLLATTVKSLAK